MLVCRSGFLSSSNNNIVATSSELFSLSQNERRAINLSLGIGVGMLVIKWIAYTITHSAVIFSDAMESVVHQVAVLFAWYAMRVSYRPPDKEHHFGHDKIAYVSAGLEGGLIIIAALVIIEESIRKLIEGAVLENLGTGTLLTAIAGGVNVLLGLYLIRTGKRESSLILKANGTHILTDAWTSGGAVVGLLLAWWTGYSIIDPIVAALFGLNIIWSGVQLIRSAVNGLMDSANPVHYEKATMALQSFSDKNGISFHRLRLRETGQRVYADVHLQFEDGTPIETAHELATQAELAVLEAIGGSAEVMTHLESMHHPEGHDD